MRDDLDARGLSSRHGRDDLNTHAFSQCFLQLSKIFVLSSYCLNEQLSDGMTSQFSWDYDRTEILADGFVHILGVAMAIAGAAMLINIAAHAGNMLRLAAIAIYLAGLLALFCFSAVYNLWPVSPVKWWLRRLDHSAIYLLIAATYTAFMLPIYGSAATAGVLAAVWSAALAGMAIKLLWPGRFDRTSIARFILQWAGVVFSKSSQLRPHSRRSRCCLSLPAGYSIRLALCSTDGATFAFRMQFGMALSSLPRLVIMQPY